MAWCVVQPWDAPLTPAQYTGQPLVLVTARRPGGAVENYSQRTYKGGRFLQQEDLKVVVGLGSQISQKELCFGYQLSLPYGTSASGPATNFACPCGTKVFARGEKYVPFSVTQS